MFFFIKLKKIIIICILLILCTTCVAVYSNNDETKKDYIKWIDFNITYAALEYTMKLDIDSNNNDNETKYNWIELLSYLACKYGGDFSKYKQKDVTDLTKKLDSGESIVALTEKMKLFSYYMEAYTAILGEFVGDYSIEVLKEDGTKEWVNKYGLKAFSPIAKTFPYSDSDDFGVGRDYGYKRKHLGHDLMAATGTPVIAIESGIIEELRLESIWRLENWNTKL